MRRSSQAAIPAVARTTVLRRRHITKILAEVPGRRAINQSPRLADHVGWCVIDSIVFVLDAARSRYLSMDRATSEAWCHWQQGGEISQSLESKLSEIGWLGEPSVPERLARPVPFLRPPIVFSILCLLRARGVVRSVPISQAVAWARQHRRPPAERAPDLAKLLSVFRTAEGVFPSKLGDEDCLPRSLALYAYLLRYGVNAEHHIGVKRFPFEAHAWVSCDDALILEDEAVASAARFTPILQSN
ncbi:MAG: lasso peptide biosynthesis B2 protein [Pseudomonadota bacterium]